MSTLYNNIKLYCDKLGISGAKLCTETGISKSTLTSLKTGRTQKISTDNLSKMAQYLGVSVDELLGNEQTEKPTAETSSELNDEGIKLAESLNSVANEMVDVLVAIHKDKTYRPELVKKTVEVVCPLSGKIEKIDQSYMIHNGTRIPLPNNGCEQFHSCTECFMCQIRVMESVR